MKLFKQINEAIQLKHLQSGFLKTPRSVEAARSVANGEEAVTLDNGKHYKVVKRLTAKGLRKGQVVLARYNTYNQGVDIVKVLGVTGDEQEYGKGGIKFDSVQEALDHYKVKTVQQLEDLQDENEYGYHSYLYVEDMENVENPQHKRGPWYYLLDGRWCRGSGAEKLSFVLMEEVAAEDDQDDDESHAREVRGFSGE